MSALTITAKGQVTLKMENDPSLSIDEMNEIVIGEVAARLQHRP